MAKRDPAAVLVPGGSAVPVPSVHIFTRPLPTKAKANYIQRCVTVITGFEDLPSPPWNMETDLQKLTHALKIGLKCGASCHNEREDGFYEITLQGDHLGDEILDILAENGIKHGWAECSW